MNNGDKTLLDRYIPITDWLRDYTTSDLRKDARAGLTVGIMLIPQGMAYALLAGLPPIYGLYAAIAPLAIYAIFGTSRQLAIGPVAIISMLISAGIGRFAEPGSDAYISLVLVTALMVGATQFLMGVFRLGFMMNFISKPVLSGFTSAAAFIIGFSQLGNLFGIDITRSNYIYRYLPEIISKIPDLHGPTFLIGLISIGIILACKWVDPRIPSQLVIVIGSIFMMWFFELHTNGIAIVGKVAETFPAPTLPDVQSAPLWQMMPTVLAVAFLGFTQSIALAKAMVRRNPDYKIDSNQELFSLGLANMVGSLFYAYPVAGSFSRTAVNDENRAKSSISLLFSALLVALTVWFLAPLIYYLPKAVLAAIIITAVPGLIEVRDLRLLWMIRKREFALMLITFISTMTLGILSGIGIGVLISLGIVIHRSSYPNIVMQGRIPETDTYRDLNRHPEALTQTNTIIIRIDASLYFANISYMKEQLEKLEIESGKNLNQVIIDATGINEVDYSALHALKQVINEYRDRDIEVYFVGVKGPVRDIFARSGLTAIIGKNHFFLNMKEAVDHLEEESEVSSHLV